MRRSLILSIALVAALALPAALTARQDAVEYKVLATSKTSTMEKEMNDAGARGYRLSAVMGGDTAVGGKEAVAVMTRTAAQKGPVQYKLLATSRTSTMQKEMNEAADDGFDYNGQTVFESLLGGREVVVIMERDSAHPTKGDRYRLLATTKTSTMESELKDIGADGYVALAMTVAKTLVGGKELVTITRRRR